MTLSRVVFSKMLGNVKVDYIFFLTMPVLFEAGAMSYHCCKQQSFSIHMLYYLPKSVNILQDWDLPAELQEQSKQCKIIASFCWFLPVFPTVPANILFAMAKTQP